MIENNKNFQPPSLRFRLKGETQNLHNQTDQMFSNLDLASHSGYVVFLQTHYQVFQALAPHFTHENPFHIPVLAYLTAIEQDLKALSENLPAPMQTDPDNRFHQIGLTYVIAGSSLGAQVILRRLENEASAEIRNATAYLSRQKQDSVWPEFQRALNGAEWESQADEILETAKAVFRMFLRSAVGLGVSV